MLATFCEHRIKAYDEKRNDPNDLGAASNLSPWLHFGQLAPQRAAAAVKAAARAGGSASAGGQSFIEEAVVRRELRRLVPAAMRVVPEDKPGEYTEVRYSELEFDVDLDEDFFSLRRLRDVR